MEDTYQGLLLTAKPLTSIEHHDIEARFAALLKRPVSLTEKVDERLIGGIRVEVAGRVYDGTVKGQLTHIRNTLLGGEEASDA